MFNKMRETISLKKRRGTKCVSDHARCANTRYLKRVLIAIDELNIATYSDIARFSGRHPGLSDALVFLQGIGIIRKLTEKESREQGHSNATYYVLSDYYIDLCVEKMKGG